MPNRPSFFLLVLLTCLPAPVLASSTGITSPGFGSMGCNGCHLGGAAPSVSITGPTSLSSGATGVYRVTVSTPNGSHAGFNLSASANGVMTTIGSAAGSQVQILSGSFGFPEATHSSPKLDSADGTTDNLVTFDVTWTSTAGFMGSVQLLAWGNSVNRDLTTTGDAARSALLTVNVCTPLSVAAACGSQNCGIVGDGCGGQVSCGTCSARSTTAGTWPWPRPARSAD